MILLHLLIKPTGANQKEVEPGVFALFTGDINQDGFIDGFDYPDLDSDSQNNLSGVYVASQLKWRWICGWF
ncbi:MAG: hypothetical protein V9H26_12990 [Verrucomicrobiota bacterium]